MIPDISMVGDPFTGMKVGETLWFPHEGRKYAEVTWGGTSLSSPLMAGVMALADDAAGFNHGFANPALYQLIGTQALHDIRAPRRTVAAVYPAFRNGLNPKDGRHYSLATMDQGGTLHTKPGFDDVTGLGTPKGQTFLNALS